MQPITNAAPKTIFGCVTDQQPIFLEQAVRLVASLRWFGGSCSKAPFVVCGVDGVPMPYREKLERLGAECRAVKRFDARHGPSNKLRFLEIPELSDYALVALLDCDTLIVQDPAPYFPSTGFAAKPVDVLPKTAPKLEEIFLHFGFVPPAKTYRTDISHIPIPPYFNAGVCLFAADYFPALRDAWIHWNRKLLDLSDETYAPGRFTDQASLSLALAETGAPVSALPSCMNFPVHLRPHKYPSGFGDIDPVIIHYHRKTNVRGGIEKPPLAAAARRTKLFNARFAQEGFMERIDE